MKGKQNAMRKLLVVLMVVMLGIGVGSQQNTAAQEEAELRYAVVFAEPPAQAYGMETYVAALDSSGDWTVTTLPHAIYPPSSSPYQVLPYWSHDGRTLYATLQETVTLKSDSAFEVGRLTQLVGRSIGAFSGDTWELQTSYDIVPIKLDEPVEVFEFSQIPQILIQSISPDGRYVWITKISNNNQDQQTALLDLQTAEFRDNPACMQGFLTWTPEYAIGFGWGSECRNRAMALNLATGATHLLQPPISSGLLAGATYLPQWGAIITGTATDYSNISMLKLDGTTGFALGVGSNAILSPDGKALAYLAHFTMASYLMRLNLETGEPLALVEYGRRDYLPPEWEGDSLVYWQADGDLIRIMVDEAGNRTETQVAPVPENGAAIGFTAVPGLPRAVRGVAASWGDFNRWVEVYQAGDRLWDNREVLEAYSVSLTPPLDTRFAGEWVWLTDDVTFERMALNIYTLELVRAPEPEATLISPSPDGEWWLYQTSVQGEESYFRLMAYQPATGESVQLWEGARLVKQYDNSFTGRTERDMILWSPMMGE